MLWDMSKLEYKIIAGRLMLQQIIKLRKDVSKKSQSAGRCLKIVISHLQAEEKSKWHHFSKVTLLRIIDVKAQRVILNVWKRCWAEIIIDRKVLKNSHWTSWEQMKFKWHNFRQIDTSENSIDVKARRVILNFWKLDVAQKLQSTGRCWKIANCTSLEQIKWKWHYFWQFWESN